MVMVILMNKPSRKHRTLPRRSVLEVGKSFAPFLAPLPSSFSFSSQEKALSTALDEESQQEAQAIETRQAEETAGTPSPSLLEASPYAMIDVLLPTDKDGVDGVDGDSMIFEMLGKKGDYIRRLGCLRVVASLCLREGQSSSSWMENRLWISSQSVCVAVGAKDYAFKMRVRNMMYVCVQLGLIDIKHLAKNYANYAINASGLDELVSSSIPLKPFGWAWDLEAFFQARREKKERL